MSARLPFALVHTIEERRVVLVIPVELEHEVQHDSVQALGIEIDPTPPWVHKMMSFLDAEENKTASSQRFNQIKLLRKTPRKQESTTDMTGSSSKILKHCNV